MQSAQCGPFGVWSLPSSLPSLLHKPRAPDQMPLGFQLFAYSSSALSASLSRISYRVQRAQFGGLFDSAHGSAHRVASLAGGLSIFAAAPWASQGLRLQSTYFTTVDPLLQSVDTPTEATRPPLWGSSEQQKSSGAPASPLRLHSGAAALPHPDKAATGGEDAHFISADGLTVGVADGVGGWAEIQVDAGIFARLLMSNCKDAAARIPPSPSAPSAILTDAHHKTLVEGSSTACVLVLAGRTLHAANLGDSGFFVLRNHQIIFRSPTQQRAFNYPYQLGAPGTNSDPPSAAEVLSVDVAPGDVLVVGTDGLFDNVYNEESAALVSTIHSRGDTPHVAAAALARFARMRAEDKQHTSPFAAGAQALGHDFHGGKLDDITVIVSYVSDVPKL